MNKRITSTIHKLDKKAKNNSWEAAYQLYEYYLEGKYVEQDYETAQFYIDLATKNIKSTYVYLEDISLLEFRALNELTLNFPEKNLTVLAGENGVGKSSVLDGLSYSLSWLVNRILYKGGKGKEIERLDIRDDSTRGYSSIIIKLAINRFAKANLELCELHVGSSANKKSHLNEISKLGALYKFAGENDASFTLPIFAHYGVSRTIDISTKDLSTIDDVNLLQINNRFEAYVNSFSGKADIKSFLKWFKRLDDIEKHRIVSSENLPTDDDLINKLAILAINDLNARKLLESLKSKEKKNEDDSTLWEISKIKKTLNQVINVFMDGYSDLSIELEPNLRLTITKNGHKLNILQLSQGEKSLIALLLDITRRMMVLNPHIDNPLESPGIIIIDELDLHLHPRWQRSIVSNFEYIFPNCQFIVSTHSPQVISEVRHGQVIMLDTNDDGIVYGYNPKQSYGLTSNEILNELMSENETQLKRSSEVEYQINNIFDLIEEGKIEDAKELISYLEDSLNGDIPELVKAKMEIELIEWDRQ
ncbi:AAA family ATPase [Pectobacterium versatile]|uniref:AAA family ATPase n=1 Tax=Pectobacterium versatile TaxID=2488639 RepID=UPI00208FBC82|nr:AAA family ATPase [Pectobacterium versatile]MCO4311837.1 AAA family ATPase [Pectobacterium versatile]